MVNIKRETKKTWQMFLKFVSVGMVDVAFYEWSRDQGAQPFLMYDKHDPLAHQKFCLSLDVKTLEMVFDEVHQMIGALNC